MAGTRKCLLASDHAGWRMAGPGGFSWLPDGIVESYDGPGLFWYPYEIFEDFVLSVAWRITHPDDNSGGFLRFPPLTDSPQPAIERGYEVQIDVMLRAEREEETHAAAHAFLRWLEELDILK